MNFPGVRLYQGLLQRTIPNYAMVSARDFGYRDGGVQSVGEADDMSDGLWCQSAVNINDIGSWKLPNGSAVPNDPYSTVVPKDSNDAVFMANSTGQVGLLRSLGIGFSPYQGMYTCTILDEHRVKQTLVVWAAGNTAYDGIGGYCELKYSLHDLSLHVVCGCGLVKGK